MALCRKHLGPCCGVTLAQAEAYATERQRLNRAISTFPKFPQQKNFSVVLTVCGRRVTRVVRERSDRPSLGKHGKRKLDELHGAREAGTASAKFGAAQRHGEALGLDQRWAGRAPVRLTLDGRRDANHGPDLARVAVVGFCR